MTDLQRVVDEIRFLLQSEAIEHSDELTSLLADYSRHCHDLNVRLRQCGERVKQGLLSEAIHQAEAAPNAMDAVAVMDFPEREQFLDVIALYCLKPPEPLLLDVASALNEAYAQHAPLQKLLDMHRLYALARAPLAQRVSILRSLAETDPASPHWELDVRDMERARLQEIVAAARVAAKLGNVAELKGLVAEVDAAQWYEAVPVQVIREVKSLATKIQRGTAQQRMEELSDELYAAFSELNPAKARSLREEWNRNQKAAQVARETPLWYRIAPVFEWLDDEDRKLKTEQAYSQIVSEIERALEDDHLTATALKRLGAVADRLDRSLPESLEVRYHNRLATLELMETRRKRLAVGGGVAAVACAIGLFGFIVYWSHQAEETRRIVSAISTLIDEGKLSDARALAEQYPTATATEAWLEMQKKLADAEHAETDRVTRLRNEIETVQQSTDSILIEAALKKGRELARTVDEKIEVGKLQSNWQQRLRDEVSSRDRQFRALVDSASQAVKDFDSALSQDDEKNLDEQKERLAEAEKRILRLRESKATASTELAAQVDLLDSRLAASRKTLDDLAWKPGMLAKLTEAILILPGDSQVIAKAGRFEAGLREYVARLPNDPRSFPFKTAADASPMPAYLAWQKLLGRWKRLRPQDEKDAEARIREIREFLTAHPGSPDREKIGKYETWMTSIARRFSDEGDPDEGVYRRMAILFNRPFVKDGYILRDVNGKTYYLKSAQDFSGKSGKQPISFEYLIGFKGETRPSKNMKAEDLAIFTTESPPQTEIAAKIKTSIRDAGFDNWRDYFGALTESLLKANRVDPFLRYLLVLKTLEFAGTGDLFLDQELAAILDVLNDEEIDRSVAWMDPLNEAAGKARKRAAELLERIPPLEPLLANAAERQDQFERELFNVRFPVGWLDKSSTGEWHCRTIWTPKSEHDLFIASRVDATSPMAWQAVGSGDASSLKLDSSVARTAGLATVIFASPRPKDSKTAQLP